ncbi:VOC family protein [Sphaerisporangium corydalis]|uniref:VOC family protein n=1 Tax=Sphaerisporangium corydalis TaxID=1441875 RepID=A0ABV9EEV9_9ACTN|nr:VOC family protein [Sphaerisporangium corydalis]
MSDPFDALREPVVPVDPDPRFAARLRARIERALLDTRGTTMTTPTLPRQGDAGYVSLRVPDIERAAAFYGSAFGWRYAEPAAPRGRQVQGLGMPHGMWEDQETRSLFVCYHVDDVRAAVERVRAAGGRAEEPSREAYGLISGCTDDQGIPFAVYEDSGEDRPAATSRQGEVVYLTVEVPDASAARAFYGSVLGWEFTPGGVQDGWRVRVADSEARPMAAIWGGRERAAVVAMYAVDDIGAAVARVRAAGGTSTDPERMPYGVTAECRDDQGIPFQMGQLF